MFITITEAYEKIMADTSRQTAEERAAGAARRAARDRDPTEAKDGDESSEGGGEATKDGKQKKKKEKKSQESRYGGQRGGFDYEKPDALREVEMPKHCCLPCHGCKGMSEDDSED